jgi:hypothetical protein
MCVITTKKCIKCERRNRGTIELCYQRENGEMCVLLKSNYSDCFTMRGFGRMVLDVNKVMNTFDDVSMCYPECPSAEMVSTDSKYRKILTDAMLSKEKDV